MSGPPCPACGAELLAAHIPELQVLACKVCRGLWLDTEGCKLLADAMLPESADELAKLLDAEVATTPPAPGERYREAIPERGKCPICARALERVKHVKGGILLDVCATHGTWFDRRELRALAQVIFLEGAEEAADEARFLRGLRAAAVGEARLHRRILR